MPNLKIAIIGNSVALRTRPPEKFPDNKNYAQYLEEMLDESLPNQNVLVINKGVGASTSFNALQNLQDYIQIFPNYYIINLGVVDASTRDIPIWFNRAVNSVKRTPWVFLSKLIYSNFLIHIRPIMVKFRGKRSWVSKKRFKNYLYLITKTILKDTNAKIVFLPINVANERVEKQLPGSKANHQSFNEIIKNIAEENGQQLVDLNAFISRDHYPDGVHYNKKGHQLIAHKLFDIIIKDYSRK